LNYMPIKNLLPTVPRDVWLLNMTDDDANSFAEKMSMKQPSLYRFYSPDITKNLPYVRFEYPHDLLSPDILILPDGNNSVRKFGTEVNHLWALIDKMPPHSKIMTKSEFEVFNPNSLLIRYELSAEYEKKYNIRT